MNTEHSRRRVALAGTGHRGSGTWGRQLFRERNDLLELVGLADINSLRLAQAQRYIGTNAPAFTDVREMLAVTRPDTLIVTTRDDTHADMIVAALESGADVITEKPMATTADMCRRILEAEQRTGRKVEVAFNYRLGPTARKIKELLLSGVIGDIVSVDFHWYLDTKHGADYFRRWHAFIARSGSLFVHKATHHFDLLNWFLMSDPREVFARGALVHYGRNGPFRSTRCKNCPHAVNCDYYFDMGADQVLSALYEGPSTEDGYYRDACVYRKEIDIFDTMNASIVFENGAQVSYSLNTFMPVEGYDLAFNGHKGRIAIEHVERQAGESPDHDEIRVARNFGGVETIRVPHGIGGHFGGDPALHDLLFNPNRADPLGQRAGARAGAVSVLTGVAAVTSVGTNKPVAVKPLVAPFTL